MTRRGKLHPYSWLGPILVGLALLGCESDSVTGPDESRTFSFDFTEGPQWTAGFADYPAGQEDFFNLVADHRPLPAPLDTSESAHFISGTNRSDDLWMYYKGRATGLAPNTTYEVRFEVEIATDVPHGCVGVGGAPGESVWMKAGVSIVEPEAILEGGDFRMNVDKGNQSTGGEDAVVLGDVANSIACEQTPRWELKELSSTEAVTITTEDSGAAWLFVGTDSGFESTTSLFYTRVTATFDPR